MALLGQVAEFATAYSFLTLFFSLIFHLARNRYKNRHLRAIPGPFLASLSDVWTAVHCWIGNPNKDYLLHRKYNSPLLRIGPAKVAVADPEAVRVIYGHKTIFKKSRLHITQSQVTRHGGFVENLASTMDEDKHALLRRPVAHAYAMSTLVEFEPLVDSTSKVFMREIENRFITPGKECDFAKWLQMYAFDVIGELTFSKRIGFLEQGKDIDDMMHHTAKMMDYTGVIGNIPEVDEWIRIRNPIRRMLQPEGEILSWTRKQIQQHSAYPDALRPDFLTRFLSAREKFPDLLDEQQTEDYANTNVAGGSDTTAVILRALVFNMLTNPKIFENFLADVKTVLKARKQSGDGDFDRPISWAEGLTMTYYQACIKEILRYHPATAQILPRIVPDEGVELCGKFIPGGTIIGCNAWTVHRDKKLYGSDADVFRPERWLDSPAGQVRQMENLNFTFGYGSRGCIGRNVAMLEITKFVPELFRRFDVELVDPRRYTIHASWLVVQSGLDVKIRMRDPESLLV